MPRLTMTDEEVFARDGFRCVYCRWDGRSFDGWTFLVVDHFEPKSARTKADPDRPENLVTACVICNQMKAHFRFTSVEEARAKIGEWRSQMRMFWEQRVKPLIPAT